MAEGTEQNENRFAELLEGDEWELPVDMALVHPAANEVRKRMEQAGWPDEELMMVDVAIDEAMSNAMVHGALGIKEIPEGMSTAEAVREKLQAGVPDTKVRVRISVSSDEARVQVSDSGNGFDTTRIPDPTENENLQKNFGRGILFMRAGFDSVQYNEKGNEVTLIKKRKSANVPSAENGER
jgi:anti-sigma regulatory factor (Ser/Thr protein kinase)